MAPDLKIRFAGGGPDYAYAIPPREIVPKATEGEE
jgi:hypothetical protein